MTGDWESVRKIIAGGDEKELASYLLNFPPPIAKDSFADGGLDAAILACRLDMVKMLLPFCSVKEQIFALETLAYDAVEETTSEVNEIFDSILASVVSTYHGESEQKKMSCAIEFAALNGLVYITKACIPFSSPEKISKALENAVAHENVFMLLLPNVSTVRWASVALAACSSNNSERLPSLLPGLTNSDKLWLLEECARNGVVDGLDFFLKESGFEEDEDLVSAFSKAGHDSSGMSLKILLQFRGRVFKKMEIQEALLSSTQCQHEECVQMLLPYADKFDIVRALPSSIDKGGEACLELLLGKLEGGLDSHYAQRAFNLENWAALSLLMERSSVPEADFLDNMRKLNSAGETDLLGRYAKKLSNDSLSTALEYLTANEVSLRSLVEKEVFMRRQNLSSLQIAKRKGV